MSFASEVKEEIIESNFIKTEDENIAKKLSYFLKGYFFNIFNNQREVTIKNQFIRRFIIDKLSNAYNIQINEEYNGKKIIIEDFHKIQVCFGQLPLVSRSDKSYFLAGVFVSCGSLNSPLSAEYHLELQLDNRDDEEKIIKIMQFFNLNPKQIIRRNKKILYLKKAVEISDFISIIHAEAKMLEYENFRIEKDFFLAATRVNNCDAANLQKVLKAGEKQLTAINKILPTLHGVKKRIAHLRIKYPERSLGELAERYYELYKEKISRSSINYYLNLIIEDARKKD